VRIAQIAPPWYPVPPSGYGGIEWVVALLADGLVERGHEVVLFAAPGSRTKAELSSPLGVVPPSHLIGDEWINSTHAVGAYLRAGEFDLVHDHEAVVGPSIGAFIGRPPVVHTLHGSFKPHVTKLFSQLGGRLWYVGISEAQRALAPAGLRWAGVVHNGIPVDHYPYQPVKDDYLLFLGRVNPEKAPELAIEASRRSGRRLVMCVKITEAVEHQYWTEKVEPLLDDDVEVLGEVSPQRKAELLAGAAALLFPIQWPEPFGLVMTEAMACGTPVVAWRNGSVPEVVADGQTGYVVDSLDAMVQAIGKLDRLDPQVMRDRVERLFSGPAMVTAYEALFERVLAGRTA
jgi:glycosyltransferase involved in cell wall biosynthesis